MFRFLENLVDPYGPYDEVDAPPQKLWPFLKSYSQPFKTVFIWAALLSLMVAIVEAIIGLPCSLNLEVIAEGVETRKQFNYLYASRCREIQGYYFSPPQSADNLTSFMQHETCPFPQ